MPLDRDLLPIEEPEVTRAELWLRRLLNEARAAQRYARRPPKDAFQDSFRVVAARLLLKALRVYDRGVRNAVHPKLLELTFHFAGLPKAFDGFRILHMTDFHFRDWPGFMDAAANLIRGLDVDLCVITGDLRYNDGVPADMVYAGLERLLGRFHSAHGVLAVLGNNDTGDFAEKLRPLGIEVLVNESKPISVGGDTIWFAGTDDPHRFRSDSLRHAARDIPHGAFTVGLIHSPELYKPAARCGIDLYLCGHTHAGQIRFPVLGVVYRNTRCPQRYLQGVWEYGNMQGYTNAGLGASTLPVRYNCPPEAALITLRRAGT